MIDFHDVMQRIEQILSATDKDRRIYNKEIAEALGLTPEYYAVIKNGAKFLTRRSPATAATKRSVSTGSCWDRSRRDSVKSTQHNPSAQKE